MKSKINIDFKSEALKAKTKFDMCYYMDLLGWRHIPWVHMMLGVCTKSELRDEYSRFLETI